MRVYVYITMCVHVYIFLYLCICANTSTILAAIDHPSQPPHSEVEYAWAPARCEGPGSLDDAGDQRAAPLEGSSTHPDRDCDFCCLNGI